MRKKKLTYILPKEHLHCSFPGCDRAVSFHSIHIYSDETAELECYCGEGHARAIPLNTVGAHDGIDVTATKQEMYIRTKVSGVTFENADGTNRQTLLTHVREGDPIQIVAGIINCRRMYLVKHPIGVLGTIRGEYIREHFGTEPTLPIEGRVVCTTGGKGDKSTRGCNIELAVNSPAALPEKKQEPNVHPSHVYMDRDGRNIYHFDPHCSGMKNAKRERYSYAKYTLKARACKKCAEETPREGEE